MGLSLFRLLPAVIKKFLVVFQSPRLDMEQVGNLAPQVTRFLNGFLLGIGGNVDYVKGLCAIRLNVGGNFIRLFNGRFLAIGGDFSYHVVQVRRNDGIPLFEQENNLIQAETEQKKKDAYLRSRHHIYHEIAQELYPCQKKIGQILDQAEPGSEDFRDKIALVCVLNAYVKRKTNLLLLAAENKMLNAQELTLSLEESANYLTIAGLPATVQSSEDGLYPAEQILSVYDAFEMLSEQLIGKASSMMVSWEGMHLLLAVPTEYLPDTEGISLPVECHTEEDILYMDIFSGGGVSE